MERGLKKLWYVKREVIASSVKEALLNGGRVYEVSLADEKYWPMTVPKIGFIHEKKQSKN